MSYLENLIFAFASTLGWSIYFNVPKKDLIACSITGAIGWMTYLIFNIYSNNLVLAHFVASFIISLLSEFYARKLKRPAVLYLIPGLIPLVPGLSIYNTMLELVQGEYIIALETATQVCMISGALVMGMLIVTSVLKGFRKIQRLKNIKTIIKK